MRSQPSSFVNCDECDHEIEVLLEGRGSPNSQIDEYLEELGWLLADDGEFCTKCKEERIEQTTTKTPNSTAPTIS